MRDYESMVTLRGLFVAVVFLVIAETCTEEINDNNGWIPITYQEAYNDLRRTTKTQENTQFPALWSPLERKDNAENVREDINLKSYEINRELMKEQPHDRFEVSGKDIEDMDFPYLLKNRHLGVKKLKDDFFGDKYNTMEKNIDTIIKRKAKKIQEDILYDNMISENTDKVKAETTRVVETNLSNQINKYEVTEASETTETKGLLNNQGQKGNKPYFEPSIKSSIEENLTNKLFSILGNYNIKVNDDLTNYAASRNKYNTNLAKIRGRPLPLKYNSQNYYPIDPLLAIFLSNYGYYLPGFYGFPANYYNIYGYLAANNIHNNKPFGAYKIYSDTDSSH